MNYDFSKCNNLRWEYDGLSGICRIYKDNKNENHISFCTIVTNGKGFRDLSVYRSYTLNDITNYVQDDKMLQGVKFIPRDPRTYTDWQVGDKVKILDNDLETVIEVGARINNIVICFNSRGYWGTYTCDELFNMGELVLTDYERTLIQVPKYVFNQGDRVLCRFDKNSKDDNEKVWNFGKYYGASDSDRYPYSVVAESGLTFNFCECIPYNENTWRLLGTKEDYND